MIEEKLLDEKVQEALRLYEEGNSYDDIRAHFQETLEEDTIKYIIRLVDEFVLEENRVKAEIQKATHKMYFGQAVLTVSVLLIAKFYSEGSLVGIYLLLACLPFFFGLYVTWDAYKSRKSLRNADIEIDDTKFRLKKRARHPVR